MFSDCEGFVCEVEGKIDRTLGSAGCEANCMAAWSGKQDCDIQSRPTAQVLADCAIDVCGDSGSAPQMCPEANPLQQDAVIPERFGCDSACCHEHEACEAAANGWDHPEVCSDQCRLVYDLMQQGEGHICDSSQGRDCHSDSQ